ncbi:MAG: low molecular weight protein arginine phosphatase [Luteolibacter sp.]
MSVPKHVLFICTGNTCRSPMAEGLFRKFIGNRGDYAVGSAGVAATRGTPASKETLAILKKRGATLDSFKSRLVNRRILEEATHVFAMTRGHLLALEDHFPEFSDKYYLVCEFAEIPGQGTGADVPDPIGMGAAAYEKTADVLETAIPTIIAYIDQTVK